MKKNKLFFFLVFFPAFIFTFIPNLINLKYPFSQARYVVENDELKALFFLKKQSFGYVFTPINKNDDAYVSAFSGKPTYLNFLTIQQTLGIDFQERYLQIKNPNLFNPEKISVKYFYLPKDSEYSKMVLSKFYGKKYQKIFENKKVVIFKKN